MKIEELNKENERLWREFVENNPEAKIQHTLEFKNIIEKSYKNCKGLYYLLKDKNEVKAIFPFFKVKSFIFGDRVISQPFLDNGGFLGDYSKKEVEEVMESIKSLDSKKIEIRLNNFLPNFNKDEKILDGLGFSKDSSKQQFILELKAEGEMWGNFHKHTRNDIRMAEKSGLNLVKIDNEKETKRFYSLYIKNMKNFGSPQHSYKFFRNIFDTMKDRVIGLNCYYKEKNIGSIIVLCTNTNGYVSFNVSDSDFREYRPNDLLYWEAIKISLKKNIKYIDFGQVDTKREDKRTQGLYNFKKKWLGKLYDRYYFNYPAANNEKKESLKKMRKLWKKIPLFILKIIGPKIESQLTI